MCVCVCVCVWGGGGVGGGGAYLNFHKFSSQHSVVVDETILPLSTHICNVPLHLHAFCFQ